MNSGQARTLEILNQLKDCWITGNVSLTHTHRDGRINSAIDEAEIVSYLRKQGFDESVFLWSDDLDISNRCWWDIWIVETNTPVNIKSSTHTSGDNACNFLALLWALTDVHIGKERNPNAGKDTREYIQNMNSGIDESKSRDYWFFSVNKKDTSEVIITSVKCLNEATVNANNLPFQIYWSKNHELNPRSTEDARKYYNNIIRASKQKDWRRELYEAV